MFVCVGLWPLLAGFLFGCCVVWLVWEDTLGATDVYLLLESQAHHHKISPIGTGRLIAMVGVTDAAAKNAGTLQILFGLVLAITPRTTKNKNELPAARIHRQCNPKAVEVAFLSAPAIEFFAEEQYQVLQNW